MKSKGLFAGLALMFLIPAVFLFTIRSTYAFNTLKNPDIFSKYENTASKTSSQYEEMKNLCTEKYLVLYDSGEDTSIGLKDNLCNVLSYLKKSFTAEDVKDFTGSFDGYSCAVVAFSFFDSFEFFPDLFDYINNGGNTVFAVNPQDTVKLGTFYRKLGIYEKGPVTAAHGIKFDSNILIKAYGQEFGEDIFLSSSIIVQLEDSCSVYCHSNEGIPLIWKKTYGSGSIIFTNGDFLYSKSCRGLFTGILGELSDAFIYPVMNARVAFIDDFPAPTPSGYNETLLKDYDENIFNFYRNVWWPDMLAISKKYNLKYSGVVIQNYENTTAINSDEDYNTKISPEEKSNLIFFGRELIRSQGEMGLHGHNHQPLVLDYTMIEDLDYKPWKDEESMINSIIEAKNYVKSIYPYYTLRSYVPASNILSPEGRDALKKALPELKVISSVYSPGVDGGGYTQEFGLADDGIIDFPRISSGYCMSSYNRWAIYDGITVYGIFSHFIHPDDILDPERSKSLGWPDMRKSYENIISEVDSNFGWLQGLTVSEAGVELLRYSQTDTAFIYNKDNIFGYCKDFKEHMYYILRTDKHIKNSSGCEAERIDENVYLIYAQKPEFRIEMDDKI